MKKKLVLKIGSSTLMAGTDKISYGKIEDIARQIALLKEQLDIILVSSGAIATAKQYVQGRREETLAMKQALSAIGQPKLMKMYDEVFSNYNLSIAQCLLTAEDFIREKSRVNTKNTLESLLKLNHTPIINENDTTATKEIKIGDNDTLSAYSAVLVGAKKLVIASDIDGIYTGNPYIDSEAKLIEEIRDIEEVKRHIQERDSKYGTGGMTTKIQAAETCKKSGVEMWIVGGADDNFLVDALTGNKKCSKFFV